MQVYRQWEQHLNNSHVIHIEMDTTPWNNGANRYPSLKHTQSCVVHLFLFCTNLDLMFPLADICPLYFTKTFTFNRTKSIIFGLPQGCTWSTWGFFLKLRWTYIRSPSGELMDFCIPAHLATLWLNLVWKRITAFWIFGICINSVMKHYY